MKNRYKSRKLALGAASVARVMRDGEPIEAYKCAECHGWHIGHSPGWRSERRP